jgi:hypothetical protein
MLDERRSQYEVVDHPSPPHRRRMAAAWSPHGRRMVAAWPPTCVTFTQMKLSEAKSRYVAAWSPPNSGADGYDAVCQFHELNRTLNDIQTSELSVILFGKTKRWLPQLFVAQVLMRYDHFDRALMVPLLNAAIEMPCPSTNQDFLTPCLTAFCAEDVIDWLVSEFSEADLVRRIGIAMLVYHMKGYRLDFDEMRRSRCARELEALLYEQLGWVRRPEFGGEQCDELIRSNRMTL